MSSEKPSNCSKIKNEYYQMTLNDFAEGTSVREVRNMLKMYEECELFCACAGILKAIEEYEFNSLKFTIRYSSDKELTNKIQIL